MGGKSFVTAGLAAFALTLAWAGPAAATTYTVTRADDPSPGLCTTSDCTLREAIHAANSNASGDTIVLPHNTYTLTETEAGAAGDLTITHDLTILGHNSTIDGNGGVTQDRVLMLGDDVATNPHAVTAHLTKVTITGGVTPGVGGGGGGVYVLPNATLIMDDAAIKGNSVSTLGNGGGGIENHGGTVILTRVDLSGNKATAGAGGGPGGAIFTDRDGTTSVYDSKLAGNEADAGGALGSGPNTAATVKVYRSELTANRSNEEGGAIYDGLSDARYDLYNTTIDRNTAGQTGGGIWAHDAGVTLKSSTITQNKAVDGGGIAAADSGGGLTYLTLAGSIVAGNIDTDTATRTTPDCYDATGGAVHSSGYNLVSDTTGCVGDLVVHPATGDLLGSSLAPVNPKLSATLSFNGGPFPAALTDALGAKSPALNAGDPNGGCEPNDARGLPRGLAGRCDIGAYERIKCHDTLVDRVGTSRRDSSGDSTMAPTPKGDGVLGLGGTDRLAGAKGDDALCGDGGNDVLRGGPGNDLLVGGSGHDICIGGSGHDRARGCEVERGIEGTHR